MTADPRPGSWSSDDHPAAIMLPFLLLASTSRSSPPPGSALEALWAHLDSHWEARETGYRSILEQTLASRVPPGEPEATEFLAVAAELVARRVHAIVSNQYRGAYERTALLAVALAEAQTLRGDPSDGAAFLSRIRAAYPRHVAFQRELTAWARKSPVLPTSPVS